MGAQPPTKDRTIADGAPSDELPINIDGDEEARTDEVALTEEVPLHVLLTQFVAETNAARAGITSEAVAAPVPATDDSQIEGATSPGMAPAAQAAQQAVLEKRGDIEQLLTAIGPFLWSLEEAQKWVRAHAAGDPVGESHARALALLARILAQLQARVDEASKRLG